MFRWKVSFTEGANDAKKIMKRVLPLDLMNLTDEELDRQFIISKDTNAEYTSRELVFKFYESNYCKILYLTGKNSIESIAELLSELPPVYIFHAELSLTNEKFPNLSCLDVLNAIYAVKINGYEGYSRGKHPELFLDNLNKIIESDLQFYWID